MSNPAYQLDVELKFDLLNSANDAMYNKAGSFSGLNYNGDSVAQIQRDAMGRETQRTLSNQLITDHSYDPQGRLQRQRTYKQKQGQLSQIDRLNETPSVVA